MSKKLYYGVPWKKPAGRTQATEAEAVDNPFAIKMYGLHAVTAAHYKVLQDNFEEKQAAKNAAKGRDTKRKKLLVKLASLRGEKKYKNDTLQHYHKDKKPEELQKLRDDLVQIDEDIKKIQNELSNE